MSSVSDEKQELIKKVRDEVEKRIGKTPVQLYKEREKRVTDAIQLKVPDRVPVYMRLGYLPVKYCGIHASTPFYDPVAYRDAIIKTLVDFQPDTVFGPGIISSIASGNTLQRLGTKQYLWPGGPLRNDQDAQFLELELMKENEYDLFIADPGDFILRKYLPRAWGALSPLASLPPLQSLTGFLGLATQSFRFGSPEIVQALETLIKAGQEQANFRKWNEDIDNIVGIPPFDYPNSLDQPPFDLFATYFRGMRGTMTDMFKQPEKLLAAMEKVLDWRIASAPATQPGEMGKRVHAGGNHFQSEEFLSKKQFEKFVWPSLKRFMLASINLGFIPSPFMEGKNDDRIEYFLELPKGKAFIAFEKIDIIRAKNILGVHLCIVGGVPGSLLWGGSPEDVDEYCKNIIKICGKDGGFILGPSCHLDDAKPANIKAMINAAEKYGRC